MGTLILRSAAASILVVLLQVPAHVAAAAANPTAALASRPDPGAQLALLGQGKDYGPSRPLRHPLHSAALYDRMVDVLRLIEGGTPADERDSTGTTPLMVAAAFGSEEAAGILIASGADPNAHDGIHGATPLHFAAMAGQGVVVRLLLAHGARLDIRDWLGETPLHYAAVYNRGSMIELLAAAGADLNLANNAGLTPFNLASRHGRTAGAAMLSRLGARQGGLGEAVNAGDLVRVLKLIRGGADVNQPELPGTALHLAAAKGYIAIAAALLDAHADIEATGDPARARPLHLAALVGDAPMAAFLIARGADAEARDGEGRTPLMVADAFHNAAVMELLLLRGVEAPARHSETASPWIVRSAAE
jgi:ankyrin repeat protein